MLMVQHAPPRLTCEADGLFLSGSKNQEAPAMTEAWRGTEALQQKECPT